MKTSTNIVLRALALALLAAACSKLSVAPGLDEVAKCRPEDPTCQPGRISGRVVYSGKKRGDVILFLFKTSALPPPDGLGTSAAAVARIGQDAMFGADKTSAGPFAADFVFTQVPPDRYQIRGFINASGGFLPFFDYARQPRAGDPVGGHVSFDAQGAPRFDEIEVGAAGDVSGISVALGQELPLDPPAFTVPSAVDGVVSIPQAFDRPV